MSGSRTMSYERVEESSLVEFHYDLAQVFIKQKDSQKAMEACRQIIKLDPNFVPAYQSLGELLMYQEDWDGAIDCYSKAIELKPDLTDVHHSLGFALSKQQKWNEAVEALVKATELNPDFSWSHNSLGEALLHLGRWKEAMVALRKAIELNPNFAWSHYNLGEVLVELEDWDGAIDAYRKASKLKPDLPNIQSRLGDALQQKSGIDVKAALNCYLEAIKQNPKNEEAYLKALKLKVNDPELYLQYGNTLVEQKRTEEAIFAYYLAIETQPDNVEYYLKLGELLIAQGQLEHAIDCYRQALKLNPDAKLIKIALEKALDQCKQSDQRVMKFSKANSTTLMATKNIDDQKKTMKEELNLDSKIQGCLEEVNGCLLKGWAYNSLNPNEPLTLIVYQNDQEFFKVIADQFRDDLQELGINAGNYGFTVRLPENICQADPFHLKIRVEGSNFVLDQSTVKFEYKPEYQSSFQGYCEPLQGIKVKGWALDNKNLNKKITISVYEGRKLLLQVKANQYRGDIHKWKKGDGYYGFMFNLPKQVLDNQRHELNLCFENSNDQLNKSPLIIEEGYILPKLIENVSVVTKKLVKISKEFSHFY